MNFIYCIETEHGIHFGKIKLPNKDEVIETCILLHKEAGHKTIIKLEMFEEDDSVHQARGFRKS